MDTDFMAIRDGLRHLREQTVPPQVFGSHVHGFRTNPPLSEESVRAFEVRYHVTLPPDYRGFLLQVGNGGAGPAHGLFRLGEMDVIEDNFGKEGVILSVRSRPWNENDGFVGVLSRPFPHTGPWNDVFEEPAHDESRRNDPAYKEEYARRWEAWRDAHRSTVHVNGALPICDKGCAHWEWLVITGPEAGTVWLDGRSENGGIMPLQEDGLERVAFLRWYRSWLEHALRKLA